MFPWLSDRRLALNLGFSARDMLRWAEDVYAGSGDEEASWTLERSDRLGDTPADIAGASGDVAAKVRDSARDAGARLRAGARTVAAQLRDATRAAAPQPPPQARRHPRAHPHPHPHRRMLQRPARAGRPGTVPSRPQICRTPVVAQRPSAPRAASTTIERH